jgi:hypothetical protein
MAALATLCTLCALLMAGGADSAGEPHSSRKFKTRQPHGSDRRPPEEEYLLPAFDRLAEKFVAASGDGRLQVPPPTRTSAVCTPRSQRQRRGPPRTFSSPGSSMSRGYSVYLPSDRFGIVSPA